MTKAAIPPADANGYWHYTYVTYHPDTSEWYGGKHSTANLDDGYLGSGNWVLTHPGQIELITEILEFFYSEEHAYAAEAALVNFTVIDADPLCRNETDGGIGGSSEAAFRRAANATYRQKMSEALTALYTRPEWQQKRREMNVRISTDPDWQRKHGAAMTQLWADPEHRQKQREAMTKLWADQEWRQKHRKGVVRLHTDPEWLKNVREANTRRAANPDWRQKMTEINIRKAADPAWRRKMSEVATRREANRRLRREASVPPDPDLEIVGEKYAAG